MITRDIPGDRERVAELRPDRKSPALDVPVADRLDGQDGSASQTGQPEQVEFQQTARQCRARALTTIAFAPRMGHRLMLSAG